MLVSSRCDRCLKWTSIWVALVALLAAPQANSQQFQTGNSRLADIMRDAESAAGMVSSGRLLYNADTNQASWGQYCAQSMALANRGEFRQAVRAASKALFLGENGGGGVTAVAYASRDLAYAYSLAGELDRAKEWAERSIAAVAAGGVQARGGVSNELLAPAHKVLGDVALRQGNTEEAARQYEIALKEISIFASDRVPLRIAMVNTEIKRGRFAAARQRLEDIGKGGDWSAMVLRARGQLAFAERNFAAAVEHYAAAVSAMKGDKDAYHLMWMQYGLGQALVATGQRENGLAAMRDAIISAKQLRTQFRSAEFRAGFFGGIQNIYDDAIGLLIDAKRVDEALALSEESRARTLLDVLKGRGKSEQLDTAGAVAKVPAETAVAVYHVSSERTIVWTVRAGVTGSAVIPVGRKELTVLVGRFRRAILNRSSDTREQAQKLYEMLIRPLGLKGDEALVVVPHRALHYLPMQALAGPQGYLIEERAVATAPSLNAMLAIADSSVQNKPAMFALGNPDLDDPAFALPGAEQEVKAIGNLYPSAQIFVQKEASKARFVSSAPGNGMIHIAAHATVDEIDPLYSSILLARGDLPRGEIEAHEILGLNLSSARLITLSGCESGLGKVSDGDEFYGFKRSFLAAGARSLLLSLWPVEDQSTAGLMTAFYRELRDRPMIEALRQAQISLLKSGTYVDPVFWAPFVLVGDWR